VIPLYTVWSAIIGKGWDNILYALFEYTIPYLYGTKLYAGYNFGAWFGLPLEGNM